MELLILIIIIVIISKVAKGGRIENSKADNTSSDLAPLDRWQIADILEQLASNPKFDEESATYIEFASALREGRDPYPAGGEPHKEEKSVSEELPAKKENKTEKPLKPMELLENINVLLFLGSFLVVISVAILVGANYEAISDGAKMTLVVLFALTFYSIGLWLFQKPKLRPAGITFTAIGMITVPLLGVAYRNFISPDIDPATLWFIVGLLSTAAYAITTAVIGHWVVYYALILAAITTVDSGLLAMDAPTYILAWVGIVMAGLMLVLSKSHGDAIEDIRDDPLATTAVVLVPIAALYSLSLAGTDSDLFQLAMTALLGGFFYLELAYYSSRLQHSKTYLGLSTLSLSAAPIIFMMDADAPTFDMAVVAALASLLWIALSIFNPNSWFRQRRGVFMYGGLAMALVTSVLWPIEGNETFWLLSAAYLAVFSLAYAIYHRKYYLWFACAELLLLPIALTIIKGTNELDDVQTYLVTAAVVYLGLGMFVTALRFAVDTTKYYSEVIKNELVEAFRGSYWIAYALSLLFIIPSENLSDTANVSISLALIIMAIGWLEKQAVVQVISQALIFIFFFIAPEAYGWDVSIGQLLLIYGLVAYPLGYFLNTYEPEVGFIWRAAGLVAMALGIFNGSEALGIAALGTLSVFVAIEAWLRKNYGVAYLSGVGFAATIHWWFGFIGVHEVQAFAMIWTLLFAAYAYSEKQRGNNSNVEGWTTLALFTFTVPLGVKTLDSGELWRALLLVGQATALVVGGLVYDNKLVWRWGAVVLVLEVLYQTRDAIAAIPKQFISLGLGLAILVLAIYFLQKRNEE